MNMDSRSRKGRSTLAKLVIIFAVTFGITFGLCTVALTTNSQSVISGPIVPIAIVIEAICIVGLIVVAILATARRNRPN
jgi:hypothetical protein